jgi:hypothetical protein
MDKMDSLDALLQSFYEDAELEKLEYRKAERERQEMTYKLNGYKLDISMETIKKGSPHTLLLTKNTNTYNRLLRYYNEDKKMLKIVKSN